MRALDTFRRPPYMHNCAQAIAYRWKELFTDPDIVKEYAKYIGGRASEGLCGALYAAMQAIPDKAQEIRCEFVDLCGAAHCRVIKSETHTPCEQCVDTADMLIQRHLDK